MVLGNKQLIKNNSLYNPLDGKYIFSASSGSTATGGFGRLSSNYGTTVSNITPSLNYLDTDISDTGEYGAICLVRTSEPYNQYYRFYNYFANSALITPSGGTGGTIERIAISGNGQYWIQGAQDGLFLSSNYGAYSEKVTSFLPLDAIGGLAISYTGQYIIACSNYSTVIYSSSDFGVTWAVEHTHTIGTCDGVAMSGNGQYRQILLRNIGSYYSHDYGASYNASTGLSPYSDRFRVDMSISGEFQLAVMGSKVYRSIDYGVSFSQITAMSTSYYAGVSVSGSGKIMTVCVYSASGKVYKSTDFGVTWSAISAFVDSRYRVATLNKLI